MIATALFLLGSTTLAHGAAAASGDNTSQLNPPPQGGVNFVIKNQHPADVSLYYVSGAGENPLASPTLIASNDTQTATFPAGWYVLQQAAQ